MTKFYSTPSVPNFVAVLKHNAYVESDSLDLTQGQYFRHSEYELTICKRFDDETPEIFDEVKFMSFDPDAFDIELVNDINNTNGFVIYKVIPKK